MRSIYAVALIVTIFFSGWYFFKTAPPCVVPLTYRLGKIDERFNLSDEEIKSLVNRSEQAWEDKMGRDLFTYDEKSSFSINFIYDKRQATSDAEADDKEELDEKEAASASVGAQYKKVLDEYNILKNEYDKKTASYESRLESFNTKVAEYNQKGGAPKEVFDELKKTESALEIEAKNLQKNSEKLASLAKNINELGEKGNALITQYNTEVSKFNASYSSLEEFTQGDYQGTSINIYHFKDTEELVNVLSHEFGHALGLSHVEGNESIMYYLMEKQPVPTKLSDNDLAALVLVCQKNSNILYRLEHIGSLFFSKVNLI